LQRLRETLLTLKKSDFFCLCQPESPQLFYFDNGSREDAVATVARVWGDCDLFETTEPAGLVQPRIDLYQRAYSDRFDWLLEIHNDMLFPSVWFAPLVNHLASPAENDIAVVMPAVINGERPTLAELDAICHGARQNGVIRNTAHVLPWLINMHAIRPCDYYDPIFHPMRCEGR
jgi:hypothetical protein